MRKIILPILVVAVTVLADACGKAQPRPEDGQNLAVIKGCSACHAIDSTPKIGPSWVGLYGSRVELADGTFVAADVVYLIEAIKEPNAKIVRGYTKGAMPKIALSDEEISSLVAYIKSVE